MARGSAALPALALLAFAPGCGPGADADRDGWIKPGDCDDKDPATHPEAFEVPYDGVDQDCDGADIVDQDDDGFDHVQAGGDDCNDYNPEVHPGGRDVPYDGTDGDCDGKSDFDVDGDGYLARGYGGEDCDDDDPTVTPEDVDGDGYNPCTGDCDEGDPARNRGAVPVCGNHVDDDCDEVSDCALTGFLEMPDLPISIAAAGGFSDHGWSVAAPGDLTGDGQDDLVATALAGGVEHALIYAGPFAPGSTTSDDAWTDLSAVSDALLVAAAGDVAGDDRAELLLGEPGADPPRAVLAGALPPGPQTLSAVALLEVVGTDGDETGRSVAVVGDRLAVGAPSRGAGEVWLVDLATTGPIGFGDPGGILITGRPNERAGTALSAYDDDYDGVADLLVSAPGSYAGLSGATYLLPAPDASGAIDDLSVTRIDTRPWGLAGAVAASGDLDADGRADLVLGGPGAADHDGAVVVFTAPLEGDVPVESAPVQRLALGDDSLGEALLVRDFDADGVDDLIVGAPATWDAGGGASKAGAVYLWYGPLALGTESTVTADLTLYGAMTGLRTLAGHGLAVADLDGDGGPDLAVGSPRDGLGSVDVLPGGQTGFLGR